MNSTPKYMNCFAWKVFFLNLEHVASRTPAGVKLFDEFFIDHLHRFHADTDASATRASVSSTYYKRPDKEENILASVEQQCRWLREIGFQDVDCFFKVFELALFGGRKTASPEEFVRYREAARAMYREVIEEGPRWDFSAK